MEFQVLGPLVAHDNGRRFKLGGPKPRLILAMLLAARGESVSTGTLMNGLWEDSAPTTARKTLQGYVHTLRTEIGAVLRTDNAGYALLLEDEQVDERRFCALVEQAHREREDDPAVVSRRLTRALELWHGHPYADLDAELVLQPEITRLEELRTLALGDRLDADLALGRHESLIGELESLIAESPLHERFRAQLMTALYRCGRHGEALRAFSRTRDHFVAELGIEPSPELADLEERILRRDPSLLEGVRESGATGARAVGGYELRELLRTDDGTKLYRGYQRSVGREVAIRVIGPDTANAPEFMARYQADTSRLAQVDHPHILHVQDTWREPDRVYQVTQWVEGRRLDEVLEDERLDEAEAFRMLMQVADAVDAAHRSDVTHGALCPGAVFVSSRGDGYLTDFAIGSGSGTVEQDRRDFMHLAHLLVTGESPPMSVIGYSPGDLADASAGVRDVFEAAFSALEPPAPTGLVDDLYAATRTERETIAPRGRTEVRNPYKGLQAFQVGDARDFFGREAVVGRITEVLRERRLVALVGPSGVGKSSVVKAGLASRLAADRTPQLVTEMYPGAYPFEELEAALRRVAVTGRRLGDELLASERGLARVIKSILPGDRSEAILVIDQFEELFSMVESERTRCLFLDNLAAAILEPRSRLRIVITMRADFFDRPLRYSEFGALFEKGLIPLTMPDHDGLAAAIERPAAAVGLTLEPGLVDEIIRDVGRQPGGLPLLQYAMTELFERRTADVLTIGDYRATGGVVGALATRAESLYVELGPSGQAAMRQAFMRLVTVETGALDVRRRVRRAELFDLEIDRGSLAEGLRLFGEHRLLTFDCDPVSRAPTVEVAHEALLGEWDRLSDWVDDQRDHLISRRRLDSAIQEWSAADEDPGYLLDGPRLAQFDAWAGETELALSGEERAFLAASRTRSLADSRRTAARRRQIMALLAVAAVAAASFGFYALAKRSEVSDQAFQNETARLGLEAGFVAEWNRPLAMLMAAETHRRDPGFEGQNALQRVLVDAGPFLGVVGSDDYADVRWATDDLLVATTPTALHIVDAATGEVSEVGIDLTASGTSGRPGGLLASSPTGIAAVVDGSGWLWLVDASSGDQARLRLGDGATAAAITDDGSHIALGFDDGRIDVLELESRSRVASVVANPPRTWAEIVRPRGVLVDERVEVDLAGIAELAFDPSGERLVSAGGVLLRLWASSDLSPLGPEVIHAAGRDSLNLIARQPQSLWFDGERPSTVSVIDGSFVVRWDLAAGSRVAMATAEVASAGSVDSLESAVPLGDGRTLLLGSAGVVTIADRNVLEQGPGASSADTFLFDTQQPRPSALAVAPSSDRFAVAFDGGIVLGALDGSTLIARAEPIGLSTQPSIAADGRTLAAGLVTDGLYDLGANPARPLSFDVNVEIADVAGSAATFEFLPTPGSPLLVWTSPFVNMSNLYDLESGGFVTGLWGSFAPAASDDRSLVAKVSPSGGTWIEDVRLGSVIHDDARTLRSADFDATGSQVLLTFVAPQPPSSALRPAGGVLLDLDSGSERSLPPVPGGVYSAAFTPAGDRIVVIGGQGSVHLLDADTLELVREAQPADSAQGLVAYPPTFSPDGSWMLSTSDGSARLWDLESGRQIGKQFPGTSGGRPFAVTDGTELRLVTAVDDNALIWTLDADQWLRVACAAAGRNMTLAEWEQYGPSDTNHRATCPDHPLPEEEAP